MGAYDDIIGQEHIKEHFRGAVSSGRVGHAYVLNGPKSSGKRMLADAFAMALQCEEGGPDPCMQCRSCRQAQNGNHPDIISVTHEKRNTISVDDVRRQLVSDIAVKPYGGRYKVYIMDEAEKMSEAAQNAMLMTFEEPPAYAVILLLTTKADALLPTILSRCIRLDVRPVPDEVICRYLIEQKSVPPDQAKTAAAFAQGNVGQATLLASTEDFAAMKRDVCSLMRRIDTMDSDDFAEEVKHIEKYKLTVTDYFDLMRVYFRDVLYMKTENDMNGLIFREDAVEIRRQAALHSYQGIEKILSALSAAYKRIRANVNFELTVELLLMTIKEN